MNIHDKTTESFDVAVNANPSARQGRKGTVTVKAGTLSETVTVIQHPQDYGGETNVLYFDGDRLEVGRWGVDVTDVADLAFFKFGSVVGLSSTGNWSASEVEFDPTGIGYSNYGNVPKYAAADFVSTHSEGGIPFMNISAAYHNAANLKSGKGDPCKLAGLTKTEVRTMSGTALLNHSNGGWRLPSVEESAYFVGGPLYSNNQPYIYIEYNNNQISFWDGSAGAGWFPVTAPGVTDKTGREMLPAAGYRGPGTYPAFSANGNGSSGCYWTGTAMPSQSMGGGYYTGGLFLHFGPARQGNDGQPNGVAAFDGGNPVDDAYPIRCVR